MNLLLSGIIRKGKQMKVLNADNHTLFREGFSRQLQRFDVLTELQEVTDFSAVNTLANQNFDHQRFAFDCGR